MATAQIPPCGQLHDAEVYRVKLQREQTTLDPVERWQLREERINNELASFGAALRKQAIATAKLDQPTNYKE